MVRTLRALRAEITFLKQQLTVAATGAQALAAGSRAADSAQPGPAATAIPDERSAGSLRCCCGAVDVRPVEARDIACEEGHGASALGCGGQKSAAGGSHCSTVRDGAATQQGHSGPVDVHCDLHACSEHPAGAGSSSSGLQGAAGDDAGAMADAAGEAGDRTGGGDTGAVAGLEGRGRDDEEGRDAVTRELAAKIVKFAGVVRELQASHGAALQAHAELRQRYITAEAAREAAAERLEAAEQENVELRELGALLSSVVKVRIATQ